MAEESLDSETSQRSTDLQLNIRCPITCMIMKEPVVAADNIIYEKDAIDDWFKENDNSPYSRKVIEKKTFLVLAVKNYIEDYIKKHPDLEDEVYKPIKTHKQYKQEITDIIKSEDWDELKQYSAF